MKLNIISLGKTTGILMSVVGGIELFTGIGVDTIFGFALLLLGLYVVYIFDANGGIKNE